MNRGRLRLLHLREELEAAEEEMEAEREAYAALRDREPVRAVSAFNLFQTPEPTAAMMAERLASLVDVQTARILEPSAGLGRLYRAVRAIAPQSYITLVEIAPPCARELYVSTEGDQNCRLIQEDWLAVTPERVGLYGAVLMNPPFKNGRDLKHIGHAYEHLQPGGAIVALCYAGPRQRAEFENVNGWNWETLPARSFRTEGTGADVAMIWRVKP